MVGGRRQNYGLCLQHLSNCDRRASRLPAIKASHAHEKDNKIKPTKSCLSISSTERRTMPTTVKRNKKKSGGEFHWSIVVVLLFNGAVIYY